MKKLSKAQFARARDFIESQARPLERALFGLEFEAGSVAAVLSELRKFQNPDGGFGQALEPDLRTPTSSALCTEVGLRYLAECEISVADPLVGAAVSYLLESFEPAAQVWRVIPEDANAHPHAPWWHDEAGSLAQTFDHFRVIPRAGILASLHHYAELVPAEWLLAITERTAAEIVSLEAEQFGGGGDTLVYALRLAEAPGLAPSLKSRLVLHLLEAANRVVTRDPEKWGSYAIPPLKIAPAPQHLAADLLQDDIQKHLDYLIEQQTAAGCWEPTWSWFGSYPEQWEQARREWRGVITLDHLLVLRAFGRLEG